MNSSSNHHYIKSGLRTLIESSIDQRLTQEAGGYIYDGSTLFNTKNSPSWVKRAKIFRKTNGEFSAESKNFTGLLFHDMMSTRKGIPPGVEVKIILMQNDPRVCIDCFDSSPPDYKIEIERIVIHLPIG